MTSEEIIRTRANECLAQLLHYSRGKTYGVKYSVLTLDQIDKVIVSSLKEDVWDSRDITVFLDPLSSYGLADFFINDTKDDKILDSFVAESAAEVVLDKFINYIEICTYEKYNENAIRYILNSTYKITIVIIILLPQLSDLELIKKYKNILDYHIYTIFYLVFIGSLNNHNFSGYIIRDYWLMFSRLLIMMILRNNEMEPFTEIIDKWISSRVYHINSYYHRFIRNNHIESRSMFMEHIFQSVRSMYPYLKLIKNISKKKMPDLKSVNNIKGLLNNYHDNNLIEEERYPNYWPSPKLGKFPVNYKKKVDKLLSKVEEEIMNEIFQKQKF